MKYLFQTLIIISLHKLKVLVKSKNRSFVLKALRMESLILQNLSYLNYFQFLINILHD